MCLFVDVVVCYDGDIKWLGGCGVVWECEVFDFCWCGGFNFRV